MTFLKIHAVPGRYTAWTLSWFLFAVGTLAYFFAAEQRHRENPDDRVMPTVTQMFTAFEDAALKPAQEEELQEGAASQ